jgi:hypothetical protein
MDDHSVTLRFPFHQQLPHPSIADPHLPGTESLRHLPVSGGRSIVASKLADDPNIERSFGPVT